MNGRVLVAYASSYGSTREVAEAIADRLRTSYTVEVQSVTAVTDLSPYQAVVVGSAARKRGWMRVAVRWLKAHEGELAKLPVAYFMTCWCLRQDTPESRAEAAGYIDLVRAAAPAIAPVSVGTFAGKFDLNSMSWFERLFMRSKSVPAGEWRDWQAIRAWAAALPPLLSNPR
ncbi:MAG: flavodoxin domain-containing protein [Anaerolineae bacterium]